MKFRLLMKFLAPFLLLFTLLPFLPSLRSGQSLTANNLVGAKNASKGVQVKFDEDGILTINGSVPGTSEAIVVDRRVNTFALCAFRPTYTFTICTEDPDAIEKGDKDCREGIHFCYEAQLVESKVKEHFILPRVTKEIKEKCKEFTGFKIALHKLKRMFEYEKTDSLFMEVKTAYMDESYFFPMPKTHCLDLQMGHDSNILTTVREKVNRTHTKMVRPVRVRRVGDEGEGIHYEGTDEKEMDKKCEEDFLRLPDSKKMERYEHAAHLNMLYMDFRSGRYTPQRMLAIVPEQCNMLVQVRGNVIKVCKSDWKQKNFALRSHAANGTKTEYSLTIESGNEQWNLLGKKNKKTNSKTQGSEQGEGSIDEETSLSGLQKDHEDIQRDSDEHTESTSKGQSSTKGVKVGASAKFNAGQGRFTAEAGLEAGIQSETSSSQTDSTTKFSARESIRGKSDTTITSTANIFETFFKSTETSIDTQNKQQYNSETSAITRKTVFKWKVKVPPGKVMVPMQMAMDCDGGEVKIPWMRFVIKDEYDDMPVTDYEDKSKEDNDFSKKHDLDGKIL